MTRRLRNRGRFVLVDIMNAHHNDHDDDSDGVVACSICGAEYDVNESPELDSTHLCAECAAMQRRARRAPRPSFLLSAEQDAVQPAE